MTSERVLIEPFRFIENTLQLKFNMLSCYLFVVQWPHIKHNKNIKFRTIYKRKYRDNDIMFYMWNFLCPINAVNNNLQIASYLYSHLQLLENVLNVDTHIHDVSEMRSGSLYCI